MEDISNLNVTRVSGGTLATATLVAINEAAQKKHATIRLVLDTNGTFLDIVIFYFKYAFYSITLLREKRVIAGKNDLICYNLWYKFRYKCEVNVFR